MVQFLTMLEDKIYQDYVKALKAKDKHRTEFLSFLRAELKNQAIDLKKDKLADEEALAIISKQKKKLLDSKESVLSSNRIDFIEAIEREINILDEYLPKPLGDEELSQIVAKVVSQTGASSMKDMGKVMKEVLAQVGVRVDSKKVSGLVKEKLSSV